MKRRIAGLVGLLALVPALLLLGSCGMKLDDFAGGQPPLLLEEYFAGKTRAWGLFTDRFGRMRRQFTVDIDGRWDGETLTLAEDFRFADGETDRRVWVIRKTGPDRYEGTADDVVGTATGRRAGNAVNWRYDLELGDGSLVVSLDDWMILQDREVLFNRAIMRKFGITLGEITIFFRRIETAEVPATAPEAPAAFSEAAE